MKQLTIDALFIQTKRGLLILNIQVQHFVLISYGTTEQEASVHIEAFIATLSSQLGDKITLTHEVLEGSHQSAFPLTAIRAVNWLNKLIKTGE